MGDFILKLIHVLQMGWFSIWFFQDEKDQRIRELTLELYNERQRCKRRCAVYQEQLQTLLKYIEDHTDHLSKSVQEVVERVQSIENEELEDSD